MIQGRITASAPDAVMHRRCLLIDEVDVFFEDSFYGNKYHPLGSLALPEITRLLDKVWALQKSSGRCRYSQVKATVEYSALMAKFANRADIMDHLVKSMVYDAKTMDSHEYIVSKGRIGYKEHDGISFTASYGFKTVFAHYKEFEAGNIGRDRKDAAARMVFLSGSFSYAEIPKQYQFVMGVTGTLETLCRPQQRILRDQYGIQRNTYVPSVYGTNQLAFQPDSPNDVKLCADPDDWALEIAKEIDHRLVDQEGQKGRAVLVFFDSSQTLRGVQRKLNKPGALILDERVEPGRKQALIRQAVSQGKVSLLTRDYGRGTDFICHDKALLAKGGVHVIQTFVSDNVSEEVQIKGRTARQGNKGSFSMVLLAAALERYHISASDVQGMATGRVNTRHTFIDERRNQYFERKYEDNLKHIADVIAEHQASIAFVDAMTRSRLREVHAFLLERNECLADVEGADAANRRTLVLMDCTGSMSSCIDAAKLAVSQMFARAFQVVHEQLNDRSASFEMMMCGYRNYNADESMLLESSSWETAPDRLRQFTAGLSANFGMGHEAIEVGLQHALAEHAKEPIGQIILVGDMPPNTRKEVDRRREHHGESFWAGTKFAQKVYFEDMIRQVHDQGIPVHTFLAHPIRPARVRAHVRGARRHQPGAQSGLGCR